MAKPAAIRPVTSFGPINGMIYGLPNSGKTRFIASAAEAGQRVLLLRPPSDHIDSIVSAGIAGVDQWVLRDHIDLLDSYEYLRHEGTGDYDWVWLDSISLWQDHGLDDMFQAAIDRKPDRAKFGPDKPEYGLNMFRLAQWVRFVVSLPEPRFHFGITAHPAHDTNLAGEIKAVPYVQGRNMWEKVCGYMNLVGYLEVAPDGTRQLVTQENDEVYAKDQYGIASPLVEPTAPRLLDAINAVRGAKPARPAARRRAIIKK